MTEKVGEDAVVENIFVPHHVDVNLICRKINVSKVND